VQKLKIFSAPVIYPWKEKENKRQGKEVESGAITNYNKPYSVHNRILVKTWHKDKWLL